METDSFLQTVFSHVVNAIGATLAFVVIFIIPVLFLFGCLFITSFFIEQKGYKIWGNKRFIRLMGVGTAIHELSHALLFLVFFIPIKTIMIYHDGTDISLLGVVVTDNYKKNFFQKIGGVFIGTAPIFCGALLMYLMVMLTFDDFVLPAFHPEMFSQGIAASLQYLVDAVVQNFENVTHVLFNKENLLNWRFYLFLYLAFCLCTGFHLSGEDIRIAAKGFPSVILLIFLFFLFVYRFVDDAVYEFYLKSAGYYFQFLLVLFVSLHVSLFFFFIHILIPATKQRPPESS